MFRFGHEFDPATYDLVNSAAWAYMLPIGLLLRLAADCAACSWDCSLAARGRLPPRTVPTLR